jgi:hypothetical protein
LPAAHDGPLPRDLANARPRARGDTMVAWSPPATSRQHCQPRHLPPDLHTQHMQPPLMYTALRLILALPWSEGEANFLPLPHSSHRALATMLSLSPSASALSVEHHRWELPLPPHVPTCRSRRQRLTGASFYRCRSPEQRPSHCKILSCWPAILQTPLVSSLCHAASVKVILK